MKKAIRDSYADMGIEAYYKANADVYENPHFPYIKQLLENNKHRIDYSKVLDLACGGGEVTQILRGCGFDQTIGCDPFTKALFEKNTGKIGFADSFEDIVKGASKAAQFMPFSSIICSFAMHLCAEKMLYSLVNQLFIYTENIIIITPHKRPVIERFPEFKLLFTDAVFTERGKKVFLKSYIKN